MGKKADKTNVMRILDAGKVKYDYYTYDKALVNAIDVANFLGKDTDRLFKTLVTTGKSGEHYVFIVPGEKELDLKKAAHAAGEKSIEMLPQKELLPLTGYIHGGCSPVGMKKQFKTFIDVTAKNFETIYLSAGHVGYQIEIALTDLQKVIDVIPAEITKNMESNVR